MIEQNFSERLLQRFCKDCNLPINIYSYPYFYSRLKLYDPIYHTVEKYNLFIKSMENYANEQDYFEDYNRIKDEAITAIKTSQGYKDFNEIDLGKFIVHDDYAHLPGRDIYHPSNADKSFLSIDMKHANFSVLKYYTYDIFDSDTWEDFIRRFTNNEHIIKSKYIRQVILGNCNPGRHITYEKFVMSHLMHKLYLYCLNHGVNLPFDKIVAFHNDELIYDIGDFTIPEALDAKVTIDSFKSDIPISCTMFTLFDLAGYGYAKLMHDGQIKLKCVENEFMPMLLRKIYHEEIQPDDMVFMFKGEIARFDKVPERLKNGKYPTFRR